ncbi:MAG: hypothetical protein ACOY3E_15050 [Pseudomonadota bacterium]
MREILQDATWQAIGAIFTVAAIAVSILLYRLQRQHRALTYNVKSAYLLMKNAGELHGRVAVLVDGVPVENVGILFLETQN